MAKYSKKLTEKIVALIEEDAYTTTDICKIVGISKKSFYEWRMTKPDFAKAIKYASERREERLRLLARRALHDKLQGHIQRVSRTVYVPSEEDLSILVIKQHIVTEKQCLPDTATIAQALNSGNVADRRFLGGHQPLETPPLSIRVDEGKVEKDLNVLNKQQGDIQENAKVRHIDNEVQLKGKDRTEAREEISNGEMEVITQMEHDNGLVLDQLKEKQSGLEAEISRIEKSIAEIKQEELKKSWQATPCLPPPLRGIAYRYRK